MEGGQRADFALRIVWREFNAKSLGDRRNLFHLQDAAAVHNIGLYVVHEVALADRCEAVFGEESLAGRERDSR